MLGCGSFGGWEAFDGEDTVAVCGVSSVELHEGDAAFAGDIVDMQRESSWVAIGCGGFLRQAASAVLVVPMAEFSFEALGRAGRAIREADQGADRSIIEDFLSSACRAGAV